VKGSDQVGHRILEGIRLQLAFPDREDCPALSFKRSACLLVTLDVAGELRFPKGAVLLRDCGVAIWAAVPEATVDEDGDPLARVGDVRMSGRFPMEAISGKPGIAELLAN